MLSIWMPKSDYLNDSKEINIFSCRKMKGKRKRKHLNNFVIDKYDVVSQWLQCGIRTYVIWADKRFLLADWVPSNSEKGYTAAKRPKRKAKKNCEEKNEHKCTWLSIARMKNPPNWQHVRENIHSNAYTHTLEHAYENTVAELRLSFFAMCIHTIAMPCHATQHIESYRSVLNWSSSIVINSISHKYAHPLKLSTHTQKPKNSKRGGREWEKSKAICQKSVFSNTQRVFLHGLKCKGMITTLKPKPHF